MTRARRRHPLVTLDVGAWRGLTRLAVASDLERWGFLCGRRTREKPACFRVSRATLGPVDKRTADGMEVLALTARAAEQILRDENPERPPVGSWHSHPMRQRSVMALRPQLSAADKLSMQSGTFDVIVVTYPRPCGATLSENDYNLVREVDGKVCRAEAWLKRDGRFLPCEMRVR